MAAPGFQYSQKTLLILTRKILFNALSPCKTLIKFSTGLSTFLLFLGSLSRPKIKPLLKH